MTESQINFTYAGIFIQYGLADFREETHLLQNTWMIFDLFAELEVTRSSKCIFMLV